MHSTNCPSRDALVALRDRIEQEDPTLTPMPACVLAAAALGCGVSTVREWFQKHKVEWTVAKKEYPKNYCKVCGRRALARDLCNTHYSAEYRRNPPPPRVPKPAPPATPKVRTVEDCPATEDNKHLWVAHGGQRVCFACREPFRAVIAARREA